MTHIGLETPQNIPRIGQPKPNEKTDKNGKSLVIGPVLENDAGAQNGGLTPSS